MHAGHAMPNIYAFSAECSSIGGKLCWRSLLGVHSVAIIVCR